MSIFQIKTSDFPTFKTSKEAQDHIASMLPPVEEWVEGLVFEVESVLGGKSWTVKYIQGNIFYIKEEGNNFTLDMISKDNVCDRIALHAALHYLNALSRRKTLAREEEENQEKLARENLYGFDKSMTALQKGKVLKTLMVRVNFRDVAQTRKDVVVALYKEGYRVQNESYGRVLIHPIKDSFLSEKTLTKTGLDLAEYLENIGF